VVVLYIRYVLVFLYESSVPVLRAFVGPLVCADATPRCLHLSCRLLQWTKDDNLQFVAASDSQGMISSLPLWRLCHALPRQQGLVCSRTRTGFLLVASPMKACFQLWT
jgi:hypothetical protein